MDDGEGEDDDVLEGEGEDADDALMDRVDKGGDSGEFKDNMPKLNTHSAELRTG